MDINKETVNTFDGGLILDLNPLSTPPNVLTNCLNGTLITFNGNEMILQNDMGNGRVETAQLPEGYIPIGTCSHGGFIYIVSYNPLKNLALIGSFPSPERNIDTTELNTTLITLTNEEFYLDGDKYKIDGYEFKPINPLIRKLFKDVTLNPGDKFIVFADLLNNTYLSDYGNNSHTLDGLIKDWKIRFGSLEESGKVTELTNLKWYSNNYYINESVNDLATRSDKPVDVDNYRGIVNSAYNIFSPKKSGLLCLLISPEMPESFSATISVYLNNLDNKINTDKNGSNKYEVWINSSWLNNGRDVNPVGILTISDHIIKSKIISKPTKLSISNDWGSILNPVPSLFSNNAKYVGFNINKEETLEKKVGKDMAKDILNNNVSEYFQNKFIFKEYKNGKPTSLYILSDKVDVSESSKTIDMPDNFINNYFHTDIPKCVFKEISIPNNIEKNNTDYIYNFDVYPCINHEGYLLHLKCSLQYDFSKVGKGILELTKWKYYVENDNMIINWGLESYPQLGEYISEVVLEFYDNLGICAILKLEGLISYHGEFQTRINFGKSSEYYGLTAVVDKDNKLIKHIGTKVLGKEGDISKFQNEEGLKDEYVYVNEQIDENTLEIKSLTKLESPGNAIYTNDSGIIYKGLLYLVILKYKKGRISTFENEIDEKYLEIDYKWLYTCPIFNDLYDLEDDFSKLYPTLNLDLTAIYKSNSNYIGKSFDYKDYKQFTYNVPERGIEDNLSANVLYITGEKNINSEVYLLLLDNFETFRIESSKLGDFSIKCILGTYNFNNIEPKIQTNKNAKIDHDLLKRGNKIWENDSKIFSPKILEILKTLEDIKQPTTNKNDKELWEDPENYNNYYKLKLEGASENNKEEEYISSQINIETQENLVLKTDTKWYTSEFSNEGIATFDLTFNAIHFSKYYVLGERFNESISTCRSPILSKDDFKYYNLTHSSANKNDYNGIAFTNGMLLTTYFNDHKDNDSAIMMTITPTYTTNEVLTPFSNESWNTKEGKHNWNLRNEVYKNLTEGISDINTKAKFIFPVFNVIRKNNEDKGNRRPGIYHSKKEGEDKAYLQLNSSDNPLWPDESLNINYKFGGFLGLCLDNNLIVIDFNHPLVNGPSKYFNGIGDNSSNINTSNYPSGNNFTYFALYVLGLLTNIYYKSTNNVLGEIISYTNYAYFENHSDIFSQDMIYKLEYNNEIANDVILMKSFNLSEYIEEIKKNLTGIELKKLKDDPNINFKFVKAVKNYPIQFNLNYILPKFEEPDFSSKSLFLSIHDDLDLGMVECNEDVLYVYDGEKLVPLNSEYKFKTYNYDNTKFIPGTTEFTIPILNNYLYINNQGKLQIEGTIDSETQTMDSMLNLRGHADRMIESLTSLKIFDNNNIKRIDTNLDD